MPGLALHSLGLVMSWQDLLGLENLTERVRRDRGYA